MSAPPPHRLSLAKKLLFSAVVLVLLLGLLELAARLLASRDSHGNATIAGRPVAAAHFAPQRQREVFHRFRSNPWAAYIAYSAPLGWTIRPSAHTELYQANARGVRSSHETTARPAPGVTRLVVLGGSFAHGDDVSNRQTWCHQLEQQLGRSGQRAEVLNLGVPGYGMDQALLRYQQLGRTLAPRLVLLAFTDLQLPRNLTRNRPQQIFHVHHVRQVGLPFTKPRFILQGAGLRLIPNPVQRPQQMDRFLHGLSRPEAGRYERFHDAAWQPGLHSYLLALVRPRRQPLALPANPRYYYGQRPGEEVLLAARIVERFVTVVRLHGRVPLVVYLPTDDENIVEGSSDRHPLLRRLRQHDITVVTPWASLRQFVRRAGVAALMREGGHYTPRASGAVARGLLPAVLAAIRGNTPASRPSAPPSHP